MAKSVKDPATIVALRGLALVEPAATPTRARSTKGPMRAPARGKAPPDVGAAIAASLEGQELELAMEKTLARKPEAPAVPKRQRQARGAALAPAAVERPGFSLDVPLADGEDAVVLLEEDGVFSWHLLGEEVTPPEVHRDLVRQRAVTGRKLASASPRRRVKRFTVNVGTTVPVARTPAAKGPVRQRGLVSFITDTVVGKVVARVFRFVARKVVGSVIEHMERDIHPGLIWMGDVDCTKWRLMDPSEQLELPSDRPARVLLWVHGTFSSTMGSFGGLSQTTEGKKFLKAALARYDAVIGFDHPTMSVTPMQNASAMLSRLSAQSWAKPPVFDAVSFSRGGAVFRSLVEFALPASTFQCSIERAVFVACTNEGTELARRKNWDRFIDRYTNLAAGACTAIGMLSGGNVATKILGEAIKGIGAFVKALAMAALDEGGMPGIEAMDPSGTFVHQLNDAQPGQPDPSNSYYCVITSNFDPDTAVKDATTPEVPTSFWMKLADKPVDELMGKENDLVVDVPSMSAIDPSLGDFIKKRYDYGTNGTVYHTVYFLQPQTATELTNWLEVSAPAPMAALRPRKSRAVKTRARRSKA